MTSMHRSSGIALPGTPDAPDDLSLRLTIAALLGLHVLVSRTHDTWLWALGWLRFAQGPLPWALMATLIAILLWPARTGPASHRTGAARPQDGGLPFPLLGAVLGAALVAALPDRTWFTGDSLLREGLVSNGFSTADVAQAMPLEPLLALRWPSVLTNLSIAPVDPTTPHLTLRLGGALIAAASVLTLVACGRRLRFEGGALVTFVSVAFLGGQLALLTGMGKAVGLLGLLVILGMACAYRAVCAAGGLGALGVVVAIALALHRSGWALLPLHLATTAWLMRRGEGATRIFSGQWIGGIVVPSLVATALAPRWWGILTRYDVPNHFARPISPVGLADLANVLLFFAPLLPVAVVLGRPLADRAWAMVCTLTLAGFVPLLFAHPRQGVARDLDVFAPFGVALAVTVAGALARRVDTTPSGRRRAMMLVAYACFAAVLPLWVSHDAHRGLARVRALAIGPPIRPAADRAASWDFLALRAFRTQEWGLAAEASGHSADLVPNPRMLLMAGISSMAVGRPAEARSRFEAALARLPDDPVAWLGLAAASSALADSASMERALARLRTFGWDTPAGRIVRETLAAHPGMADASAREEVFTALRTR